jgi:predicted RNA binding protein YcfA (HicA-like mRNA interferase family)
LRRHNAEADSNELESASQGFERYGCVFQRQKGDHLIFHHPKAIRPIVIPKYEEVPVTIILTNMRTVGMSREEYFGLLEEA